MWGFRGAPAAHILVFPCNSEQPCLKSLRVTGEDLVCFLPLIFFFFLNRVPLFTFSRSTESTRARTQTDSLPFLPTLLASCLCLESEASMGHGGNFPPSRRSHSGQVHSCWRAQNRAAVGRADAHVHPLTALCHLSNLPFLFISTFLLSSFS